MKRREVKKYLMAALLTMAMAVAFVPMLAVAAPETGQDQTSNGAKAGGRSVDLKGAQIVSVSDWQSLQNAINNNENQDKIIQLADNILANGKNYLSVSGKTATIDLNGKQLNRQRTKSDADGHVFWVKNKGNLTITDSKGGGEITGGWANNGGGINVQEGSSCTIEGGNITGNKAEDAGGGICAKGSLTMTGGSIQKNSADTGGGIFCTENATNVSLKNVTISENTSGSNGPGIDTHAAMKIEKCIISNNECSDDSGGGIYADASGKTIEIKETLIKDNKAKNDGGGIRVHRGTVKMTDGSIMGCTAGRDGGGVYIKEDAVFRANGTFIGKNSCSDSGGGIRADGNLIMEGGFVSQNTSESAGGGIYCDDDSDEVNLTDVVIEKNEAKDGSNGGGIDTHVPMTIDGCSIRENKSDDNGGGLYVDASGKTVTIEDTDLVGNSSDDDGGGMYIKRGDVKMTGGSVTESSADDGGGVYVTPDTGFDATEVRICENKTVKYDGAGILNKGEMTLTTCEVSDNTAKRHAAGIWNNSSGNTATIEDTNIDDNTAQDDSGGGIYLQAGTIEMTGGSVSGNKSEDGGGVYITSNTTFNANGTKINKNESTKEDGGGILNKGYYTLTNCEVSKNKAKKRAGGIWHNSGHDATITNTHIDDNTAGNSGGGIHIKDGTIRMTGGTISGNSAGDGGGVVLAETTFGFFEIDDGKSDTYLYADGTSICHNKSTTEDGAAVMNKGNINLKNCTVEKNSSARYGGGIYSNADYDEADNDVYVENTSFTGNKAGEGGAIYMRDGDITLKNTGNKTMELKDNAAGSGGAIYVGDDADADIIGTQLIQLSDNFAKVHGGAIYNDGDLILKEKVKISENTAKGDKGNAIYQIGGLKVSGTPNITGDIFLCEDKIIKVDDSLAASAHLDVAAEVVGRKITDDYNDETGETSVKFFAPASDKYSLKYDDEEIYISDGENVIGGSELISGDALNGVTVKLRPSGSDLAACVKYGTGDDDLRIDFMPYNNADWLIGNQFFNDDADRNGDRWYLEKAGDNCYRILYYDNTTDDRPNKKYDPRNPFSKQIALGLDGNDVKIRQRDDSKNNQKWEFYRLPDGTYCIKNVGKGTYWSADDFDELDAGDGDKTEVTLRESPLTWWMEVVNKKVVRTEGGKEIWENSSFADYNAIADAYDTYNQSPVSNYDTGTENNIVRGHDWMSHLPDDMPFTELNIPGSHDTAAFNIGHTREKRCQEYYYDELLNLGMRGTDIRIGSWDKKHGSFKMVHSDDDIKRADGTQLYFDEIMQQSFDFLEENPGEFLTFKFQPGEDNDDAPLIYQYLKNLAKNPEYKDKFYLFDDLDDVPTLGDLRGKIYLHPTNIDDVLEKMDAEDISDLADDVSGYDKKSDSLSTIENIGDLNYKEERWETGSGNEKKFWAYERINTVDDDTGWDPDGDGNFLGLNTSRESYEIWSSSKTKQMPFGKPISRGSDWWSNIDLLVDGYFTITGGWGNKWRDIKNDFMSKWSVYNLKQNVESRGKKAWIVTTSYCTMSPWAWPSWSAHELHPVLLRDILHSGEFMTTHDGFTGELRFNFMDKNTSWSTYRLNFLRNNNYEELKTCVLDDPAKENEVQPTCTKNGSYDIVTRCKDCNKEVARDHVTVHSLGHDWDDGVVTRKATTYNAGVITYKCKRNGCDATRTSAIPPAHTQHEWDETKYTWKEDGSKATASHSCKVCDLKESETVTLGEGITKEVTKPATCLEVGETTYTAVFENSAFGTDKKVLADIEALGHDWDEGTQKAAPTCETEGTLEFRCKRENCGETREETIPALGHEWPDDMPEPSETVEPKCEEDGYYILNYNCTRKNESTGEPCGALIAQVKITLPMTGHDWGEWMLVDATDEIPAHYERKCRNNESHIQMRSIDPPEDESQLTKVDAKAATCTNEGSKEHWIYKDEGVEGQTGFVDRYFVKLEEGDAEEITVIILDDGSRLKEVNKEDIVIPALGHKWGKPEYDWADDFSTVTAKHDCEREGCEETDGRPAHEEETASIDNDTIGVTIARQPSCTQEGAHLYMPVFSNADFEEHKEGRTVDDIPKTAHNWAPPTYEWAEDNSFVTAKHRCRDCSAEESETADLENGQLTIDVVSEATETSTGKTEYKAVFENTAFEEQTKTVTTPRKKAAEDDDPIVPDDRSQLITFTVTFKVTGGSWNDGTKGDKIVKKSRYEDEDLALMLESEDIPAAGSKPSKGYKKGKWNVTPSTEMVLSKDATYIYSYAKDGHVYYTVTFVDGRGKTLKKETVQSGKSATAPSAPKRKGYTFKGWDKNFGKVTSDMTVTAKWKKNAAPNKTADTSLAKLMPKGSRTLVLSWTKTKGAKGYDIYFAKCGKKFKKVRTIKGNKKFRWTKKNLKKKMSYKAYAKAWVKKGGKKKYISKTPVVHAYTFGGTKRYTNAKSVKVRKKNVTLMSGAKYKIKGKVKKLKKSKKLMNTAHTGGYKLRYRTSNPRIATISKKGVISAKAKGSCKVYVFAHNGVRKTIKVTVK